MSMDLYCRRCGEPFELLGITDDFTDEEKKRFWSGEGCPCCLWQTGVGETAFPLRSPG